jgi:UDP-glucose 4-epimerase
VGSRRILIIGVSSERGGRLAQLLEADAENAAIVGVDTADPRHELHRTEFVRLDMDQALLARILTAASIDTVVDTRPIPELVGTRNLLVACSAAQSHVRKLIFTSSAHYYGSEDDDPAFFTEDMGRQGPARTPLERAILAAERAVEDFAAANPQTTVTVLRFADAIGGRERGDHLALLGLPIIPAVLGFDPRFQFIHEQDAIGVLAHAVLRNLPGSYNAAADGVLALSEVAALLGKPLLPVLPPWGTFFAAAQLRRLRLPVPIDVLAQLRHGRGLDNRRLKASGYLYSYTTREAVLKLRAQQRLRPLLGSGSGSYRYEREVEEFLRWSPSVRSGAPPQDGSPAPGAPGGSEAPTAVTTYDHLSEAELIGLISSLETPALHRLRAFEASHQARPGVLEAVERALARRST